MFALDRDILLDRGITDAAGTRHRLARLLPMDGRAEEALAARARDPIGEDETSRFLAERLAALGGFAPVTPDLVDALGRDERDRLLLELRAGLFGDLIQLTARCQNPACGAPVDLDLTVGELLSRVGHEAPATVEADLGTRMVRLRPVLGGDDPEADEIWPALIEDGPAWDTLSPAERQAAALALARADNGPELGISAACPECRRPIDIEIVPIELLARELALGSTRLLAEVHSLAFHYGWSEADILALPRHRRWQYLGLITAQVTGGTLTEDWR